MGTKTAVRERFFGISQTSYVAQRSAIEEAVEEAGELCLFLPKYHCELNIIEFFWGSSKRWTREHCDYTINGLLQNIPIAQGKVSVLTIRRWYARMMRWIEAYEKGSNSITAQEAVRKLSTIGELATMTIFYDKLLVSQSGDPIPHQD